MTSTSQQQTEAFLDCLLTEAIRPNAVQIAAIVDSGGIPVVTFEPCRAIEEPLRAMGWNGRSTVFRLTRGARDRMVAMAVASGDAATQRWLKRHDGPARILVVAHCGSLLVNVDDSGFSIEPGSTDGEYLS